MGWNKQNFGGFRPVFLDQAFTLDAARTNGSENERLPEGGSI